VLVPEELSASLRLFSRRAGVTLYMTLLAAFQTLLHRYSGQDEVVVGSPVANRTRAESEDLIGCFINTLALRGDLSGNPTFGELLRRVRETTLEAYAHQDLPFELLVSDLQPERRANHTPLFQVWFVLQNAPVSPLRLPGVSLSPYRLAPREAQFDLTMSLIETEGGVEGLLTYNTDLFDGDTVEVMVGHYLSILGQVVERPEWRLLDIPLEGDAAGAVPGTLLALSEADEAEDQFAL
jgi:non-ribosomal peptide synthetase component F